jgi:hypothetical protein
MAVGSLPDQDRPKVKLSKRRGQVIRRDAPQRAVERVGHRAAVGQFLHGRAHGAGAVGLLEEGEPHGTTGRQVETIAEQAFTHRGKSAIDGGACPRIGTTLDVERGPGGKGLAPGCRETGVRGQRDRVRVLMNRCPSSTLGPAGR